MPMGPWYGRALALAGGLAVLLPALAMRGFTVDDALISLRYAAHLASGAGWRFSVHGPITDGVTPLPWVPILALFARQDLLAALDGARALGVVAATLAGARLGFGLRAAAPSIAAGGLVVLALAFPVGAWAVSGMETGLVIALATLAACERSLAGAALGGLAAAFRPELVVWSVVQSARRERMLLRALLAAGPFAASALVRLAVFGRPVPLALAAKPSDPSHGLVYALAALLVVLTPVLVLDRRSLRRPLALAALAHVAVVVAVGGDWMPYARLLVPIAPSLLLVHAEIAVARRWALVRVGVAIVLGAVHIRAALAGRHVLDDRRALVVAARPLLAGGARVAALDIGWVGAATDADIVDLAGLTDPTFAFLPGGHTSKRVDTAMLLDRGVDTLVLFDPPRVVEARLVRSELFEHHFAAAATVPLGSYGTYTIYRRR